MELRFEQVAPYVAALVIVGLGLWLARKRDTGSVNLDAADLLLRQNFTLNEQLRAANTATRKVERAYQDLVIWAFEVQRRVTLQAPSVLLPPMPVRMTGDAPSAPLMTDREEVGWRKLLIERLSDDEIGTLAWDIGFDNLPTTGGKSERVKAVLDFIRQRRAFAALLEWLHKNRPDVELTEVR